MSEPALSAMLTPARALIFRLVHLDNVGWLLENGLHSANSPTKSSKWVAIGNSELIDKRSHRVVPIGNGGVLSDYVPFYFTPRTPMLGNIHFGKGVRQFPNRELVFLVTSLKNLIAKRIPFVFTDAHAVSNLPNYFDSIEQLHAIAWSIIQSSDFKRDAEHPEKFEQYQAEALVYKHCPADALLGLACFDDSVKNEIEGLVRNVGLDCPVYVRRGWYFQ